MTISASDPMDHEAIRALEHLLAPAGTDKAVEAMTILRNMTAARQAGEQDLTATLALYGHEASGFPEWAIHAAVREWASVQKFWPTWAELRLLLENQVAFPRALLAAYRDAANKPQRLAAPEPPPRDPRDVPRAQWTTEEWTQHVETAIRMADTMGAYRATARAEWLDTAAQRLADAKAHGHDLQITIPTTPEEESAT